MKRWISLLLLFLFFLFPSHATEHIDNTEFYRAADGLSGQARENMEQIAPQFDLQSLAEAATAGELSLEPQGILSTLAGLFSSQLSNTISIMGILLLLSAASAVFGMLQSSFGNEATGKIAFLAFYSLIVGFAAATFAETAEECKNLVNDLVQFMQVSVPAIGAIMATAGHPAAATSMTAGVLLVAQVSGILIKTVIVPLTYCTLAISLINHITENAGLSRLSRLAKRLSGWVIGMIMTIFTATLALSGFASGVAEGLAGRTAKFAVASLIPVAGGALAETVQAVTGSAMVLKNATGVAGIVFILILAAVPLVRLAALIFLYRVTAALMEPIADRRFAAAIDDIAGCLSTMFTMVAILVVAMLVSFAIMMQITGM